MKLAGIEPDGFVAPAYAYTAALRETLTLRFRWWAGLLRVHRAEPGLDAATELDGGARERADAGQLAPAWSLTGGGPVSRMLSPSLVRAGALLPTRTLRLDLHPADLRYTRHMLALEWVLAHTAARRRAVTYRELAGV
jgi:hypothetical protein